MRLGYTAQAWLATAARLIVGALLLWSGLLKLTNPAGFLRGVVAYGVTPDWLSRAIAYGLPTLLLCLAVLLIAGLLVRIAAVVAAVLQLIFLIGLIFLSSQSGHFSTGAFGIGGVTTQPTRYLLVGLLNIVLIALCAAIIRLPESWLSVDELLQRGDHVPEPSAKRLRSEQGRRKYEAEVAAAQARVKERNKYLRPGVILPVVLISFIAIGVQAKRSAPATDTAANASHVQGVSVGNAAPVTIDVFEDFQSKASLKFEKALGADLDTIAASGNRQVRYHMVAIYDASSSGNRYSARAANAAICASDISNLDFKKFHRYLFGVDGNGAQIMPAVGSHGRTDASLIQYGQAALGIGLTDLTTFQICVQSEEHKGMVEATTLNFTNRGYSTVPYVLVNGKKLTTLTTAALDKAVASAADAAAKAAAKNPKPSSSATPTGSSASTPASGASSSAPAASSAPASSTPAASSSTPAG